MRSAPATAAKNSQPGKTLTPPAAAALDWPSLRRRVFDALAAEARIDRGQQALGDRSFSERKQLRFVQAGLRALRFGIEFADGLNLVAEELDADRAVGFGE